MTTLLIVQYKNGRRARCDATCHTAASRRCPCVCGGAYHGAAAQGEGLAAAVAELQPLLLSRLGILEQAGELRILAWRETVDEPLQWRTRRTAAVEQVPLFTGVEPPPPGGGTSRA